MSSTENISPRNTLDIVRPFAAAISNEADVQIMGGISIFALEHPLTEINTDKKEIYAPKGLYQSSYRENGSLRDVDAFVISSDADRISYIESILEETVGDDLERAVFGIHPHEDLHDQLAHPMGKRVMRMFASDRYEVSPDVTGVYVKSLFPFAVPIEPETLEPWQLITDDYTLPVPHPGTTITNYMTRSISGVRHKDLPKMTKVTTSILEQAPEIREWLLDGPGKSQIELATLIASLHTPGQRNIPLLDGIKVDTFSQKELREHERFMLKDMLTFEKMALVSLISFKARRLKWFESQDLIVEFWQNHLEKHAQSIVKNK